jgi:diaminopropionate ammonia-lyase
VGWSLVNHHARPDRVPAPAGPAATQFHLRLPGYAPTPVRALPGIANELGIGSLLLKDESDRLALPAFKILGASWAVDQTLRRDPAVRTLVAASAGNHGRAVARCAAQRGLACRIYLPAGSSPARAGAIASEGALVVPTAGGYDGAVAAAVRAAGEAGTALVADVAHQPDADSPRWVVDGYATLFRELTEQLAGPVDLVLVPVGVGSLAAAAVRWASHEPRPALVVGVEPTTAACVTASLRSGEPVTIPTSGTTASGLDCATPSTVAWPALRDGLAGTVTVDDPEIHQAMRELAGHGLAIGDCGAAPLAALRRLMGDPDGQPLRTAVRLGGTSRVLFVATEGPTDPASYRAVVEAVATRRQRDRATACGAVNRRHAAPPGGAGGRSE